MTTNNAATINLNPVDKLLIALNSLFTFTPYSVNERAFRTALQERQSQLEARQLANKLQQQAGEAERLRLANTYIDWLNQFPSAESAAIAHETLRKQGVPVPVGDLQPSMLGGRAGTLQSAIQSTTGVLEGFGLPRDEASQLAMRSALGVAPQKSPEQEAQEVVRRFGQIRSELEQRGMPRQQAEELAIASAFGVTRGSADSQTLSPSLIGSLWRTAISANTQENPITGEKKVDWENAEAFFNKMLRSVGSLYGQPQAFDQPRSQVTIGRAQADAEPPMFVPSQRPESDQVRTEILPRRMSTMDIERMERSRKRNELLKFANRYGLNEQELDPRSYDDFEQNLANQLLRGEIPPEEYVRFLVAHRRMAPRVPHGITKQEAMRRFYEARGRWLKLVSANAPEEEQKQASEEADYWLKIANSLAR